ncbi:MAG: hypothetical protein ABSB01_04720 [Streptosporangiaceae bacterium]|jgi:hypothetical protein
MSCEHLICAQCAGPVAEGRCPVCQAARTRVHHHHGSGLTVPFLAVALILLLALMLALEHVAH